ncbi:hypothetical protein D3C81_1932420 [compost metagenome]
MQSEEFMQKNDHGDIQHALGNRHDCGRNALPCRLKDAGEQPGEAIEQGRNQHGSDDISPHFQHRRIVREPGNHRISEYIYQTHK